MRERNLLLDYLKGIAIFLVVWGHTIQYAVEGADVYANPVFTAIYSFHMPLFIAISGYLFFQSQANRSFGQLVQAKVKQILVPLLLWAVILLLVYNRGVIQQPPKLWPQVFTLAKYVDTVVWTLWFLWASFICAMLAILVNKKLGDSEWAYLIVALVVLVLPNAYYFFYIKYMLPYFFGGYLYHKHAARLWRVKRLVGYLAMLAWPLLLLFWQRDMYIYLSGPVFTLFDPHSLFIIGYRYLIGVLGVVLFITLVQQLLLAKSVRALVGWLGTYSLGIYVIGFIVNPLLISRLHLDQHRVVFYSLTIIPVIAAVVAVVTGGMTQVMSRIPLLNQYLLGGRSVVRAQKPPLGQALPLAEQVA